MKYYNKFPSEFEERNNNINEVVNLPGKIRRDAEREGGECPRYPIRERVPKGIHRTNDQIACLSTSEQPNFQKIINQRYIRSAVAVVRSMVNGYQDLFQFPKYLMSVDFMCRFVIYTKKVHDQKFKHEVTFPLYPHDRTRENTEWLKPQVLIKKLVHLNISYLCTFFVVHSLNFQK